MAKRKHAARNPDGTFLNFWPTVAGAKRASKKARKFDEKYGYI